MKIRKIQKKDLKKCAQILEDAYSKKPYNEKFSKGSSLKYIENKYEFGKESSFILELNGKIIGFIFSSLSYWANGPQAIIEEIVIDEKFRGKNYSKKLVNYLERHLKKKKVKTIMLWAKKNSPAHKFHIKNEYKDANDLAVMFKELK